MKYKALFDKFDTEGKLVLPGLEWDFSEIPWSSHPVFEGVELKHVITAKQTGGAFSFHLVRIGRSGSMSMRRSWKPMKLFRAAAYATTTEQR